MEEGKEGKEVGVEKEKGTTGDRRRLAMEIFSSFILLRAHLGRLDLEREVVGDALDVAREHVVGEEFHRGRREKGEKAIESVAAEFDLWERKKSSR